MRKTTYVLTALILCLTTLGWAGEKRPMSFEDIFTFKSVTDPQLSPDGKFVVFTAYEADWEQNRWVPHLWRVPIKGGEAIQLTRSKQGESSPRWSPDGRIIAFKSGRDGSTQVYFMYADGGEAWKVTHHNPNVTSFAWSRDGEKIYFTAPDSLTKKEKEERERGNDAILVDRDLKNVHLWEFDIATKKERKLTSGDFSIRHWKLSPDGEKVAFIAAPTPKKDDDIKNEIYLLNLKDLKVKKLTENKAIERSLEWSPDGKTITFISDSDENLNTYFLESIFLLPLDGDRPIDLLPGFQYQVYSHFWHAEGDLIYFVANTGVNTHLFTLNLKNGDIKQLTDGVQVIGNVHYNPELNLLVLTKTDPAHPKDVYCTSLGKIEFRQLTRMNPQVERMKLAQYKTIRWKSTDGQEVEGLLILPPDYNPLKRYPLILQIHGGPEASYKNYFSTSWATYPHVLAGKGYVIFQPNYRGSTGYGDECMRAIIGHYFEKDYDDLMTGVDCLIQQGIVDSSKMGVMGWSAGGHLTNWIVTHTDRFKAASSGAGGANWLSFYAQTDMQYIREIWFDSSPYENTDLWIEKSPVMYVKNARTPTIFFCGENDARVPLPQTKEMYMGLKRNGCPTELVIFPREGHGLRELRHQMYKMKKEFAWFQKYIMGKEEEMR